jgi:hypothetical protein
MLAIKSIRQLAIKSSSNRNLSSVGGGEWNYDGVSYLNSCENYSYCLFLSCFGGIYVSANIITVKEETVVMRQNMNVSRHGTDVRRY